MTTSSFDHWRGFLRATGDDSDIFLVIEQAIRVAAFDHPEEFKSQRDEIAQLLFTVPHRVQNDHEGGGNAVKEMEVEEGSDHDGRDNAAENGKIRLRRLHHHRRPKPSEPQRISTAEHQPEPPVIAPSSENPQGRLHRTSTETTTVLDDASLRSKLEATKRKLRESYQQTEIAKRQRRIQVIQPRTEIPKDSKKKPLVFKSLGTRRR